MKPLVGIIMGSDSDAPIMQEAAKVLQQFGVAYEIGVYSAHRSPHRTNEYITNARTRGLKLIIAGAGSSAHLAGVGHYHVLAQCPAYTGRTAAVDMRLVLFPEPPYG